MTQLIETQIENSTPQVFGDIDIQVKTAKMYPRNVKKCLEEALELALLSPETAESCFYTLERKGKDKTGKEIIKYIQGPSVRASEIIASSWGNIHIATRIIDNDGYYVTAEAYCWDLEKNVRIGAQIKKSIQGKYGIYSEEMQAMTGNAAASTALRNSILKVIPKAYADSIVEKCKEHLLKSDELQKKVQRTIERFEEMGIKEKKILDFFSKKSIKEFNSDDLANLFGIGTALKEGHMKIEEAFQIENVSKSDQLSNDLESRLGGID